MATGVEDAKLFSEAVVAIGAALMALIYGARRVYKMAKNIETLLADVRKNNEVANDVGQQLKILTDLNTKQHQELRISHATIQQEMSFVKRDVEVLKEWRMEHRGESHND